MISPTIPTTKAGIFQGFAAFLSKRGVKFSDLLSEVGFKLEDVADPSANVSLEKVASVLERAAKVTCNPCLGLHWGEAFPVGASGVFGYALANARTLQDAMEAAARYHQLVMHPADISFTNEDGLASLSWSMPFADVVSDQYVLMSTTAALMRLRKVVGPGWQPFAIEFTFRPVPCDDDLHRILGPTVRFDMDRNAIVVDSASLKRGASTGDARLFKLVSELGERMLEEQSAEVDVVMLTRREILDAMRRGDVSLDTVSSALGMNGRLLQSKLAQRDTNFEVLLTDIRKQQAMRLVRDTDKPLSEIALELGFSELSAFSRAFSNWTGKTMSPTAFRKKSREEKGR